MPHKNCSCRRGLRLHWGTTKVYEGPQNANSWLQTLDFRLQNYLLKDSHHQLTDNDFAGSWQNQSPGVCGTIKMRFSSGLIWFNFDSNLKRLNHNSKTVWGGVNEGNPPPLGCVFNSIFLSWMDLRPAGTAAVSRCTTWSRASRKFIVFQGRMSFDPRHVARFPSIGKRIWVRRYKKAC